MELDGIQVPAAVFCRCHRAVFCVGADRKARRRLGDIVKVAHPADGGWLDVGKERGFCVDKDFCLAVFPHFGCLDFAS